MFNPTEGAIKDTENVALKKFVRKAQKNSFWSNNTRFEGWRKIKKVFLSSTQVTKQHGLCCYSGVFSLSHRAIEHTTHDCLTQPKTLPKTLRM